MQTHMPDRGEYRSRTDEHLVTVDDSSWQFFDTSQISYGDLAKAMLDEVEQPKHRWVFVTTGY
jgi:putative NADH-flavin reductase